MQLIPLFPLETVLFPGMALSLQVFEPRYQALINRCLEQRESFGVVLIKEGQEALGPLPTPYRVGCTARIQRIRPRGQERMEITVKGQERFIIHTLNHEEAYLSAEVTLAPLQPHATESLASLTELLRQQVRQYLDTLMRAGTMQMQQVQLPADPVELAYLALSLLQHLPLHSQQRLLELSSARDLLIQTSTLYHVEIRIIETMISRGTGQNTLFSLN